MAFQIFRSCTDVFFKLLTPEDVLFFHAGSREAHAIITLDAVTAAKFAISRWYSDDVSLSVWRFIWQQCMASAREQAWNPTVWKNAVTLIEAANGASTLDTYCSEYDDYIGNILSEECDFYELTLTFPNGRKTIVEGIEEHFLWKT